MNEELRLNNINKGNIKMEENKNLINNQFKDINNKKRKVFLSHPMHNKSDADIEKIREKMIDKLAFTYGMVILSDDILDNVHHKNVPENAGRIWHLGESIKLIEKADLVVFHKNWKKSKGCKIEMEVAKEYGKTIFILGD